jgi:hypothetical protein
MTKNNKSGYTKNDKDSRGSNNYFAIRRRKRIKRLLTFVIPIAAVIIAFGVYIGMQAREQGFGAEMVLHIHPKLTFIVAGNPTPVPKNIGIDPALWKDHSLDKYGMAGMAPIHTHDSSGTIHVESNANRNYTFDEFLKIWGIDLSNKATQITLNGKPTSNLNFVLKDGDDISMVIKL